MFVWLLLIINLKQLSKSLGHSSHGFHHYGMLISELIFILLLRFSNLIGSNFCIFSIHITKDMVQCSIWWCSSAPFFKDIVVNLSHKVDFLGFDTQLISWRILWRCFLKRTSFIIKSWLDSCKCPLRHSSQTHYWNSILLSYFISCTQLRN